MDYYTNIEHSTKKGNIEIYIEKSHTYISHILFCFAYFCDSFKDVSYHDFYSLNAFGKTGNIDSKIC